MDAWWDLGTDEALWKQPLAKTESQSLEAKESIRAKYASRSNIKF